MKSDLNFSYMQLKGRGQNRFLQSHTTSSFQPEVGSPTALLNAQGRVIACAYIIVHADDMSSTWVLEESTVLLVQQHLQLATQFARLSWQQIPDIEKLGQSPLIPWFKSTCSGHFTAHDLSLDILGMLDFNKGCYLGQEIVARVQSRIKDHKKRLFWIATQFDAKNNNSLYSLGDNTLSVCDAQLFDTDVLSCTNCSIRQAKSDDIGPEF